MNDALVRPPLRILVDDTTDRYVVSPPVIHPPTGEPGRLWLVVRELLPGDPP